MSLQLLQTNSSITQIFQDPNHSDKVSETFEKFYQEQIFLDIVLIAGIDKVKVKAHRLVISASSDYFLAMFSSALKEANAEEIELKAMDGVTLLSIIEFMYSGTMLLHSETVQQILIAADFLQMNDLIGACCQFLAENLDLNDCLYIALFTDLLNYTALSHQAYSMTLNNFEKICDEKEFLEINHKQLTKLISFRDEADCSVNEETIFLSIGIWVAYDRDNREQFLFDLLSLVEFQALTPKFIIENRHSICTSLECYEMILSWLEWHLVSGKYQSYNGEFRNITKKKNVLLMIPGGTATNKLKTQFYKSQLNRWYELELPISPVRKEYYGVVVVNQKLITVGGNTDVRPMGSTSIECLHLSSMDWSELPHMKQNRHHCAVTELNGDLYVIGGFFGSEMLISVEKYECSTGKWYFMAPLIEPLRIPEVAVLNGKIYAIDVCGTSMQCFDPSTNEWSLKTFKQESSKYFGIASGCGNLYTVGGSLKGKPSNTVERYNPNDDTWSFVARMEHPRSGVKCAFLNNCLVACAGRTNAGLTNAIEEYNPRKNEWNSLSELLCPLDGRAKLLSY